MTSSYIPRGMVPTGAEEARREAATQEALTTSEAVSADDQLRAQQEAQRAELEAQDAAQQQERLQQAEQAAGAKPMGFMDNLAEAGGAVVGGAIDAFESVGGTAEKLLTGKIADPNFKPTWLQVADEKEPLTRTVWGQVLRGISEYGTLAVLTRKAAKGAKAMRVPGATALSQALNADKAATKAGKLTRMATKGVMEGAAVDFISSYSEGETLSNNLKELMPWLPTPLAIEDDDTPLERRAKNVLEGVGLGLVGELALGWRRAKAVTKDAKLPPESKLKEYQQLEKDYKRAQKALTEKEVAFKGGQTLTAEEKAILRQSDPDYDAAERLAKAIKKEYTDLDLELNPKSKAEARIAKDADSRQANFDEKVKNALADDPEGLEPNAWVNAPLFDRPDKALFTPGTGNAYFKNLRDAYIMDTDPTQAYGRRVSVYTESALEKRLAQFDPERRKIINEVAKGIDVELNEAAVAEAAGQPIGNFTTRQLKNLSTARYLDLLDEVVANPDDLEGLRKMLTEGAVDPRDRTNAFTGTKERFLGLIDHRAVEMLVHTTAGEISDLATVARSLDGTMDNSRSVDALINRMKFMLAETARAKYISGFDLQGLKADAGAMPARLQQIDADVDASMKDLRRVFENDPELARGFLDAAVLANGSPKSLNDMYGILKERFSAPGFKDLIDGSIPSEERNELIRQLQSMSINGILSGPRTLARATLGNGLMIYTRPAMTALGGLVSGDRKGFAMGLASIEAALSATQEAWKVVGNTIRTNLNGEMNVVGSRFVESTGGAFASRAEWESLGKIINMPGAPEAPKVWYGITSALFNFNSWIGVKYPNVIMKGLDDGTAVIMSRIDAKISAFDRAWNETGGKNMDELVRKYTDEFLNNQNPDTLSAYAKRITEEAGLRLPLSGHMKRLETALSIPAIRPFFLFMQTGVNALEVVRKHTPILATFADEYRDVMSATPDSLDKVLVYGINNPGELLEAQMVMKGRVATGYLTVSGAIGLYMSGKLTGNGPIDREERDIWSQTGWQARSIKVGNTWVDYSAWEPFNSFLTAVADIGDNANKLGQPATQNMFAKLGFLVAQNVTNKSFLQGIVDLGDLINATSTGSLGRVGSTVSGQINSFIPWAGARRELSNILNPGMRELDYDLQSTFQRIQNANPYFKGELPLKYDILDGSVVGWAPPIQTLMGSATGSRISLKDTPTRRTLRESGYDVSRKFKTDSYGNKLTPEQRSKMQQLIGQQNLEGQLEKLFAKPDIKAEMESYEKMRDMGIRSRTGEGGDRQYGLDLSDTKFYQAIDTLFSQAQSRAEAQLHQEYPNLRRAAVERRSVEIQQQEGRPDAALQRILNYQNK